MSNNQLPPFPQAFKSQTKPHLFCPGCGHPIALKSLAWAIDELKIAQKSVIGFDIGCALLAWDFLDVDSLQTHHGRTVPVIAGLKLAKPKNIGIAYIGDGGGYAIGLQALLSAAHRNDNITVILINNTVYAMTGGQMAPTTLCSQKTETTPQGRACPAGDSFHGPEILKVVSKAPAYIARGIVSKPLELKELFKKALEHQMEGKGFSFVEVLSLCPTNWHTDAKASFDFLEKEMVKNFPPGIIKLPQKI